MKDDIYQKEFNRFLDNNQNIFNDEVIEYGENFIEKIKDNDLLKEYFNVNSIGIYPFLSEFIPNSQHKFNTLGDEILDENEINQVFGSVILNNEILRLLLKDEIFIKGINVHDEFVYELSDSAIEYFKLKYGIVLNKNFSFSDILIVNIKDDDNNYKYLQ